MSLSDDVQFALGDGYLIERELGRGGMGAVFLARDVTLERSVAVKALPAELAAQPQLRERFLRETRIVASFSHPNIVPVHAVVERAGTILFVMGYVEGETLTQRVRHGGPLAAADAVRLLQELAWALSYAHGRDVIHRDVKPDNVILERATGRALLTDFGIARTTSPATALTSLGEVLGTPHFMSPEQAAGEAVDGRSDLYSLGVTAFFAVTGRLLFDAPTTQAILAMHLTQPAPSVAELRPDLPLALGAAIDRCLAKEPDARFASGESLVSALESARASVPVVAPAVRQFLTQGDQSLRMLLALGMGFPVIFVRLAAHADTDRAALSVLCVTLLLVLLRGLIVRARTLVRQGHSYAEVSAGAVAAVADRKATVAALHADPVEQRRRRRERNARLLALATGAGFIWFSFTRLRIANPDGSHGVGTFGSILAIAGLSLVGFGIVSALTEPGRSSPLQKISPWLWSGPIGRFIFRAASRGLPAETVRSLAGITGSVVATSPASVLASLPRARRRELHSIRSDLGRLDSMLDSIRTRQSELDLALAEARRTDPSLNGAAGGARQLSVVEELTAARRAVSERLVAIVEGREAVRLQLIRFRTGLGTAADIRRELAMVLGAGGYK